MRTRLLRIPEFGRAVALLVGTTIGVGIFGVPYAIVQSGTRLGFLTFAVVGIAALLVHLAFAELTLRTTAHHRLVGYAGEYLGRWGRRAAAFSGVIGIIGALLVYLTVIGQFLHMILGGRFGGLPFHYSVAFALLAAVALAVDRRIPAHVEFILTALLFIALVLIAMVGAQRFDPEQLRLSTDVAALPYGVLLFALSGASAIAEIRTVLIGQERLFGRVVVLGTALAAGITAAFAVIVIGVSGAATTTDAIQGLSPQLGPSVVILGAMLGVLAIGTSFLTLGRYLVDLLHVDLRSPRPLAAGVVIGVPLAFLSRLRVDPIAVMTIVGAFPIAFDGILVALSLLAARKHGSRAPEDVVPLPNSVLLALVAFFVLGMVATALTMSG